MEIISDREFLQGGFARRIGYASRTSAVYVFMTAAFVVVILRDIDVRQLLPFMVLLLICVLCGGSAEWLRRRLSGAVQLQAITAIAYLNGLIAFPLGALAVQPVLSTGAAWMLLWGWIAISVYMVYQTYKRHAQLRSARNLNEASGRINLAEKRWDTNVLLQLSSDGRKPNAKPQGISLPVVLIAAVLLAQFMLAQTDGLSVGLSALFEVSFLAVMNLAVTELAVLWELICVERQYGLRLHASGN